MVSALDRKLLRDLWALRGQAIAIALILACGIATFVMSLGTLRSLDANLEGYYERQAFADVFARVKRAPSSLASRIREIPGVAEVEARIVVDVTLDVPGMAEPASGRLISLPATRPPRLNRLYLRRGRWIEPDRGGEVLVGEAFAVAHGLEPGDSVSAVVNGRRQRLRIVGVALSPEYVYQLREGDLVPDDRRFGVFWTGERELAAAFDLDGAFNDVSLKLGPDASAAEVIDRLDGMTARYGGLGAYGRRDQRSHQLISAEMRALRGMGVIGPSIFLVVAAFLLHVVIARIVATERDQIATLRAFGYEKTQIARHYLRMVLVIAVAGGAIGTAVGAWLGNGLTRIYTRFFRFPSLHYQLDADVVAVALMIGAGSAVLGALGVVLRAARLPPAEAMRPEAPASFRPALLERFRLGRRLTPVARMIVRHLERQPIKSALSCAGFAAAIAVLVLGTFLEDAVDAVIDQKFVHAERQDATLTFVEPVSHAALHAVGHLPGVLRVEAFRSTPARFRFGHRSHRVGILGLARGATLVRAWDAEHGAFALPADGVVVSRELGRLLGASVGDRVEAEVLEGDRPVRQLRIAGLLTDFSGTSAYMDLAALHSLLREGDSLSGAFLSTDSNLHAQLYAAVKETPRVAGMTLQAAAVARFRDLIAENVLIMKTVQSIFAAIIAFGVVYNTARISLSERARDLATLRVIGFTRGEISTILLGELGVLAAVSIPLGIALGYVFAAITTVAMQTETQRFPLVVNSATYAFAVSVVTLAGLVSALVVRRRLDRLDLIAVLKAKE
jgi:putative ABC transport system permease protein